VPDSVANEGQESWRPILLLNATHEESGNRIITGQFLSNATSLLTAWTRCMSLERTCGQAQRRTTARVSLRFSSGRSGYKKGSVIDGGYFENYGALSALEIARAAKVALKDAQPS
jgi:hypothetical protein